MIKVYIPSPFYIPVQRQFPNPAKTVWGNCEFVFSEVDDYDYIVVIDSLKEKIQTPLSKTQRIIFLGEPPYVKIYNDYQVSYSNRCVFSVSDDFKTLEQLFSKYSELKKYQPHITVH